MSITHVSNDYVSKMRLLALNPSSLSNEEIRQFKKELYFKKLVQTLLVVGVPTAYIFLNNTKSNGVVPVIFLSYLASRCAICLLTKKSSSFTDRLSTYNNELKRSVVEFNGFKMTSFDDLGKTHFRTTFYDKFRQI